MPWCPKCRNEYVEGITRCADCGSELVDSLKEVERETLICADAEKIQEMRRFFLANGLKDVQLNPGKMVQWPSWCRRKRNKGRNDSCLCS